MIVPEEMMETLGSTCWLFALGYWLCAVLPVGLFPLDPVAGMLNGRAIAKPDAGAEPDQPAQTPTTG